MKKILLLCLPLIAFSFPVFGQARPMEKTPDTQTAVKKTAPQSFEAKYEGGIFGFNDKETGTLKFDDVNERIVFYDKEQKERFSISFASMLLVHPQSQSVRSTTGTVISAIPLPGTGLAGLIREKRRYLVIHYSDPDIDARGVANFKLDNKELLDAVIQTIGDKAKLTQRGEAFYRPKKSTTEL